MERQEARNIAIKSLLENSSNRDFFTNIFETYLNQGYNQENIPVPSLYFDNVNENNNQVFIEENVYNELLKIREITQRTNNEIPYFLIGYEKSNGAVVFKSIIVDVGNSSNREADFDNISDYLGAYIESIEKNEISKLGKPIICNGHTHGISNVSDNFSFGDMISYITFKNNVREYMRNTNNNGVNPKIVDTVGMLMNPCGDFNLVYYDDNPQQVGFYKFTNIFLRTHDNQIVLLPSISENGNYIRQDGIRQTK